MNFARSANCLHKNVVLKYVFSALVVETQSQFTVLFIHFRQFNLRMKRDTSLFSDDFKVEVSNQVIDYDTSHIYTGHIYGKCNTSKWMKMQQF